MCVIIYKPKGASLPSKDVLAACRLANPHGQGFASESDFYKSIQYSSFIKRLKGVRKEENCIIHFRFATHGSIKLSNCHPFVKSGTAFAHNGVLDIMPIGDKTDSETAFLSRILPTIKRYGLHSIELDRVIYDMIGYSKFVLMQGGDVRLFGTFYEYNGCYFSNMRFLRYNSHFC